MAWVFRKFAKFWKFSQKIFELSEIVILWKFGKKRTTETKVMTEKVGSDTNVKKKEKKKKGLS